MPQMSPINWLLLMFVYIILLMMTIMFIFYLYMNMIFCHKKMLDLKVITNLFS